MANDLCTDLDQLLAQARERPLFDRFGYRERAKEVPEIVGQRMKLQSNGVNAGLIPWHALGEFTLAIGYGLAAWKWLRILRRGSG